jgi:hypothetical protein
MVSVFDLLLGKERMNIFDKIELEAIEKEAIVYRKIFKEEK